MTNSSLHKVGRPLVILESPYGGPSRLTNLTYLRKIIKHSLDLGEAPFASHRMYTDALNDEIPQERELGIHCGYCWWPVVDLIVFYTDLGWSDGMKRALERCHTLQYKFEERHL